jgi:hypothetical protein
VANDIAQWLEGLGLSQYAQSFADHDIDLEVLPRLSRILNELGLTLGHCVKLQADIVALAKPNQLIERVRATETASLVGPISYTSQHLVDRMLNSRSALGGERKQVTVLFAEIKGSTALIEGPDPQQAITRLQPVEVGLTSLFRAAGVTYTISKTDNRWKHPCPSKAFLLCRWTATPMSRH